MLQVYLMMIDDPQDKDKFNKLVELYENLMYSIALKIVNNHHIAEEVVQDSFFRIAKNIHKIGDATTKESRNFVSVITNRIAKNTYNHEKQFREKTNENEVIINEDMFSPDVLDYVISEEGYGHLLNILDGMNQTYKETMRFKIIFQYTNDEIAEMQGIPKRAVEMRVLRGKDMIKKILEKERDDYAVR